MNDLYNKAIFLHQSKKFLEAEKIYQKILENDPNNSEIFYLLGVLRFQLGDFIKAKFFLSKSVDLNSSNPAAFNNLGMIFKQQGEVAEAIININKAWRQVSQSTIVNCWRKADILDNKSIDYSIDLNNFELDIFFMSDKE